MKSMFQILFAAAILAILAACNQPDFPKYTDLGDLRILTVISSAPEASPGDTVTFTPVLSDLNGQGRTIHYSVEGCIDPGVGIGVEPACSTPDLASMQSGTVVIPAGSSQTYTGSVASFSLTMPDAATMFAYRSAADQYNGVAYLVFYRISIVNGPSVDSFLRVIVTPGSKTQKNQNPAVTSVDVNNIPITGIIPMPGSGAHFRVTAPAGSSETYQFMQRDGSFKPETEELVHTWFVSDGKFDYSRTIGSNENTWNTPSSKPVSRGMVIFVVTRDGRGGSAWQKVEMN